MDVKHPLRIKQIVKLGSSHSEMLIALDEDGKLWVTTYVRVHILNSEPLEWKPLSSPEKTL